MLSNSSYVIIKHYSCAKLSCCNSQLAALITSDLAKHSFLGIGSLIIANCFYIVLLRNVLVQLWKEKKKETWGDQSRQVTTRCLDHRSSMNCLLRDSFAPAWISLGGNKAPQINKSTSSKTNYKFTNTSCHIITPPSPPGHGHCSQKRHPRALIEPAQ